MEANTANAERNATLTDDGADADGAEEEGIADDAPPTSAEDVVVETKVDLLGATVMFNPFVMDDVDNKYSLSASTDTPS